ncbi:MAG: TonB-dependent receptor [Lutimonas sp.]
MKLRICTLLIVFSSMIYAQEDSILKDTIQLDEVLVKATRVEEDAPFTQSYVTKEEIEARNLGQDLPILLNFLPNVVTTSDAGNGVGYTGIRVRGSDATRVNVTINGIPLNDSESHGTFWVNLPDFASSTQSVQLQRGVGSSTNGAGAFGASLSLSTDGIRDDAFAEVNFSGGSYNTFKANTIFGTGVIDRDAKYKAEFSGRVSTIQSDGYIDRASSDLKSLFLSATIFSDKTMFKALVFGGHEVTYQAWYGIDAETLERDRRYNPAGEIYDDEGSLVGFYDNQVDDYKQDHYQLHINHDFGNQWTGNLAFHYTYCRGFYEEYINDGDFATYGFEPIEVDGEEVSTTDLVRRKWLDNDFYGTTFSLLKDFENLNLIIGGALNKYDGDHFGEVKWARFGSQTPDQKFYENTGLKTDYNVFVKADYAINDNWRVFGDLQYRRVDYEVEGIDEGPVTVDLEDLNNFFNPKFGLSYFRDNSQFYFSYARGNKEPKRADYLANPEVRSEKLDDFELGWKYLTENFILRTNLYYMYYTDQLVLTGELDDVGNPIADNVGESYRLGLEVDAAIRFSKNLLWQPNFAVSMNKNIDKLFEFDGVLTDFGNTDLAYSPGFIAASNLVYEPLQDLRISWLAKYVGEQYMSNIEHPDSKLDAYFVNDLQISYEIRPGKLLESVVFNGMVNNFLNAKYVSNGYFFTYDDTWSNPGEVETITGTGYYPQAEINFLLGVSLRF